MRSLIFALFFVASAFATEAAKTPGLPQPIAELKLTNGTVFRNVTVVRYERDRVVLKSASGIGPIAYSMISEPTRGLMLAERDAAVAAPKKSETAAPSTPAAPRTITGEAFLSGGDSQGIRVKFAGATVTAYPLAGVSAEQLHAAFGILSGKAAELATGNKEVQKAMAALGIDTQAFLALPVDRQLEMIAKGYANADDKGRAFAAVADLIGTKNAPRLNAMLKDLASEGLDGVIHKAREAGQVMSEETISDMDEFGDRVDTLKSRVLNFATGALDLFMKFGQGIGYAAAAVVNYFDGIDTAWDAEDVQAKKAIATVEKLNVTLRGTAATQEEIARAIEAKKKHEEAATMATMDGAEKVNFLREKMFRLTIEESKYSANTKEQLKLRAEIEETVVKSLEEQKRIKDDLAKKEKDLAKASLLQGTELAELLRLQYGLGRAMNATERLRFDQLQLISKEKLLQAQIDRILEDTAGKLTDKDEENLAVLVQQKQKLHEQIDVKGRLIEAAKAQVVEERNVKTEIEAQTEAMRQQKALEDLYASRGLYGQSRDAQKLTDRQLEEHISQLRQFIFEAELKPNRDPWDPFLRMTKTELNTAEAEKNLRRQFRYEVATFGEQRALAFHSAFEEERLRGYIREQDAAVKTANTLEEINRRLSHVFSTNGAPV